MDSLGEALTRLRASRSWRNVSDISTIVGLPGVLLGGLRVLSERARGPMSFLQDLDWGWYLLFGSLSLLLAAWHVGRREHDPIVLHSEEKRSSSRWLTDIAAADRGNIRNRVRFIGSRLDVSHLEDPDSHVEIHLAIFNAAVYTLCGAGLDGRIRIYGYECSSPPEFPNAKAFSAYHGDSVGITLRQALSSEMKDVVVQSESIEADLSGLAILFDVVEPRKGPLFQQRLQFDEPVRP